MLQFIDCETPTIPHDIKKQKFFNNDKYATKLITTIVFFLMHRSAFMHFCTLLKFGIMHHCIYYVPWWQLKYNKINYDEQHFYHIVHNTFTWKL